MLKRLICVIDIIQYIRTIVSVTTKKKKTKTNRDAIKKTLTLEKNKTITPCRTTPVNIQVRL